MKLESEFLYKGQNNLIHPPLSDICDNEPKININSMKLHLLCSKLQIKKIHVLVHQQPTTHIL